ncbi:NTP transferase domain-containing protein [Galbibacter sp. BG1]|uniref:NTP transferase domain-containing protein n=1 Tax=Galbibacter sp. BG1 TaxID=1170699 RepID=UPI0015BF232B|nr:NTP transferase domain-containing protein [Galbibacter sp. BG1]QLE00775.1 NTP transferase domain-containing protein [Galbibacter sp. BG1]
MTSIGKLNGLVLAGGQSRRMRHDKGLINYHGLPQRTYLYQLLQGVCDEVFISIRQDQKKEFQQDKNVIVDENVYQGPFNGILSAYNFDKEASWLVLATDLPLLNQTALLFLKSQRDPAKLVTAFASKKNNLPEPLCAIWEPKGCRAAMDFIAEEKSLSPVKFLLNNKIKIVNPLQDDVLLNANSEEDRLKALQKLNKIE